MKIAIISQYDVLGKALEMTCALFSDGLAASVDEADLVVCEEPRDCLVHLKRGKYVAQFVSLDLSHAAVGLIESYPNQFRVFTVIPRKEREDVGGPVAMWNWIANLSGKEGPKDAEDTAV